MAKILSSNGLVVVVFLLLTEGHPARRKQNRNRSEKAGMQQPRSPLRLPD